MENEDSYWLNNWEAELWEDNEEEENEIICPECYEPLEDPDAQKCPNCNSPLNFPL